MSDIDDRWCGTYFLNEDKTYKPCPTLKWAKQLEEMTQNGTKHVADDIIGNKRISTVWLGVDHQWQDDGKPLLFETMIFDDGHDIYQERYSTWKEAEAGHLKAIQQVIQGCKNERE